MSEQAMRIVFVIHGLTRGGAEAQLVYLTRELAQRGHAVAIYIMNGDLDRLPELEGSGVHIEVDRKRMKLDPGLLLRLARYIRQFRADVVQGFLYDGNFYGRLAARMAGVPAFDSERNDNYQFNRLQKLGDLFTRHLTQGVVANSHSGARFARNLYHFPEKRVHVVWNGIPIQAVDASVATSYGDYRKDFFNRSDARIAVLVGNIKPQKDYELALDVANELLSRDERWCVLLVGDDIRGTESYKQAILQRYESHPYKKRIVFAGRRTDVLEIVSQCEVLFSTSLHEGFPNVVLEAMAVGTPVVSTEYSDISMILPNAWQVVRQRDAALVADAIQRASQLRAPLAAVQRSWVEANASVAMSTNRLLAVYRQQGIRCADMCKQEQD
jgi:glycosyltransferase involved in cell wall biosynthesis